MALIARLVAALAATAVGTSHAANTYHASACTADAINTAIGLASHGDTVIVPAGSSSSGTTINLDKGITLQGAGPGLSVITRTGTGPIVHVDGSHQQPVRITGFTFDGSYEVAVGIRLVGGPRKFRIDHNRITRCASGSNTRAILITGGSLAYGVIDHNEFIDNRSATTIVYYGDRGASFARPSSLGLDNQDAVWVEDNTFSYPNIRTERHAHHAISSNDGSRYVFRYNTVTYQNASVNPAPIDVHGQLYSTGRTHGSYSAEIYENTLNTAHAYRGMYIRGGRGVIWNNRLNGSYTRPIVLTHEGGDATNGAINNMYIWGNTHNGSPVGVINEGGSNVVLNTHYWLSAMPGYTPYTYPHPLQGGDGGAPGRQSGDPLDRP